MIFTEKPHNLDKLEAEFIGIGIDKETVELALDYLDTSKERDDSILDSIKKLKFVPQHNWRLEEAVSKQIVRTRNDELVDRYIRLCWKLSRTGGASLLGEILWEEKHRDKLINCLKTFFLAGSEEQSQRDAQAIITAIIINHYSFLRNNDLPSPEICLRAAEIVLEDSYDAALRLITYSLSCSDPDAPSPVTDALVEMLKKTWDGKYMLALPMALASAIPFEKKKGIFGLDLRKEFTKLMKTHSVDLISTVCRCGIDPERIFKVVEENNAFISLDYLNHALTVVEYEFTSYLDQERNHRNAALAKEHLKYIAKNFKDMYIDKMKKMNDAFLSKTMLDVLSAADPAYGEHNDCGVKKRARDQLINLVYTKTNKNEDIGAYLLGKKELADVLPILRKTHYGYTYSADNVCGYSVMYGDDDTVARCLAAAACCNIEQWDKGSVVRSILGVRPAYHGEPSGKRAADCLMRENVPLDCILGLEYINAEYLVPYADKVAEADYPSLNADQKALYIETLAKADPDKYREKLFAATDVSARAVRGMLEYAIPKIPNCQADVENLLTMKKAAVRETALGIISYMPDIDWSNALKAAYEKEKSEKLRAKIGALIGVEVSENKKELSAAQLAAELTKGTKVRKLEWLFRSPYKPVHLTDGTEADEKYLQAIMLCYSVNDNEKGRILADSLNRDELAEFAMEVFGRWIDAGADAKNKWLLVFVSVCGTSDMIHTLVHYIKYWSENMRGAMAVAAVKALALNGSPEALMEVDNMARKYKSNQVKVAANQAIAEAADFLNITAEELADRIVPDMNFDEKMCRTFDYGSRKFSVYLTPSLEIEIFNGDKKVKNMPKPGVNDTAEIAERSYAEFKEMKKQLKNTVAVQKARLEYALMCERKWTSENWNKLFVRNPVMHCFAIGLIWGVYEDDKLVSTFRYMDDGSFTTVDEDEFTLPENAAVSLVHPIELSAEEIAAWSEQLSDYEITQPFPQLARPVYRCTDEEAELIKLNRFAGKSVNNLSLQSKLLKMNWFKGTAGDGGWFVEFTRSDIARVGRDANGKKVFYGWHAELSFTGMSIMYFDDMSEDVDIEELVFFRSDENGLKKVPMKDVNKRYFSEVVMQLTSVLGE